MFIEVLIFMVLICLSYMKQCLSTATMKDGLWAWCGLFSVNHQSLLEFVGFNILSDMPNQCTRLNNIP